MENRPTKIDIVKKVNGGYSITCVDELSGSANGIDIPENGYLALREHFRTGAMEISSDELSNCNIHSVSGLLPTNDLDKEWSKCKAKLKLKGNAGEMGNWFGMFLHGWRGRNSEGFWQ